MKERGVKHKSGKRINGAFVFSLLLLAVLVGCYFLFPSYKNGIDEAFDVLTSKDQQLIQSWVERFGIGGPIILILLMVAQMFLLFVPNLLIMMIAIISYGPFWGSVISLAGVFASSSVGYFIGRRLGVYTLNKLVSKKLVIKLVNFIEEYGVGAVAIIRLSSLSTDALGFAAGLLRMSYKKYILATLAGITPVVALLAIYGNNGKMAKGLIWIAGISMVLLISYIIFDKRKKKKQQPAKSNIIVKES